MMKIHPLVRRYVVPLPFLAMMGVGGAHQVQAWMAAQPAAMTTMEALVAQGYVMTEVGQGAASPTDAHLSTHVYRLTRDGETWRCVALVSASLPGTEKTQYGRCDPEVGGKV